MAHNQYSQLKKLIEMLDDDRADIYLHIDKKAEKPKGLKTYKSGLIFVKSIDVQWGGYSQIECELSLLKNAIKSEYDWYHLLSGADLPIVSSDELNYFFDRNSEKNFIRTFSIDEEANKKYLERIKYYYPFQDLNIPSLTKWRLNRIAVLFQSLYHNRLQKSLYENYYMGDQWFSITNDAAKYVVNQEKNIWKTFRKGLCIDELFMQTVLMNSSFRDTIENRSLRYIDWTAGGNHPKTFTVDDYNSIMSSGNIFARKFSEKVDNDIIDKIYNSIKGY